MLPHPLTNFEIWRYYQDERKFNGVYLLDNLPKKIKDGTYIINLDEYTYIGTHWITLHALNNDAVYLTVLVLSTFLKRLNSV